MNSESSPPELSDSGDPGPRKKRSGCGWFILGAIGVALVILLAALFFLSKNQIASSPPVVSTRAQLNLLKVNLLSYQMNAGQMPTTAQGLQALVQRPEVAPLPTQWRRVLDQVPVDAWGQEFRYRSPGKKHPESIDLFSIGADGIEGTADDLWQ